MINTGDSFFDAEIQRDAIEQAEWEERMSQEEYEPDHDLEGEAHREAEAMENAALAADDFWRNTPEMFWLDAAPVIEPALSLHCFELN